MGIVAFANSLSDPRQSCLFTLVLDTNLTYPVYLTAITQWLSFANAFCAPRTPYFHYITFVLPHFLHTCTEKSRFPCGCLSLTECEMFRYEWVHDFCVKILIACGTAVPSTESLFVAISSSPLALRPCHRESVPCCTSLFALPLRTEMSFFLHFFSRSFCKRWRKNHCLLIVTPPYPLVYHDTTGLPRKNLSSLFSLGLMYFTEHP